MAVILLPLHMPATHWVPQRLTFAPIPKTLAAGSGAAPSPELDYWEFPDALARALRVQFRMPDGYDSAVDPIFTFNWFTSDTLGDDPDCNIGQEHRADGSALGTMGVGTQTRITGMVSTDTGNECIEDSVTLPGANWTAGHFSTIVFYRHVDHDNMDAELNFLGGDLLIGVTKEMG